LRGGGPAGEAAIENVSKPRLNIVLPSEMGGWGVQFRKDPEDGGRDGVHRAEMM